VRAGRLGYKDLDLRLSPDDLTWKVAYFGVPKYSAHDVLTGAVVLSGLEAAYALLGVDAGDDRDTVKQAYRLLARRYHPDQNQDPAAHEHMQRLNDAYQRVLAALDVGQ
jgi:DnaJ-class molecular chaperone